jgi:hypothetical protein
MGLRGTYAKMIPNIRLSEEEVVPIDFVHLAGQLCNKAKDKIRLNLQEYAKDGETAEVHLMVAEGLYYDTEAILGLFELPRI